MKLLVVLLALGLSHMAFGKSYQCEYESDGETKAIKVSLDKKSASISLNGKDYKGCRVDTDEFGQLVDCSEMDLDLMVLINETQDTTTGGIMSSTYDLFVDLEC